MIPRKQLVREVAEHHATINAVVSHEKISPPYELVYRFRRWPQFPHEAKQPDGALRDAIRDVVMKILRDDSLRDSEEDSMSSTSSDALAMVGVKEESGNFGEAGSEEEFHTRVPPAYLDALTEQVSDILTRIFALIPCHHPRLSTASHVKRYNWVAILDILYGSEIVSPTALETTRNRLRQMFGPEENRLPCLEEESGEAKEVLPRSVRTQASSWDLYNILNTDCSFKASMNRKRKYAQIG